MAKKTKPRPSAERATGGQMQLATGPEGGWLTEKQVNKHGIEPRRRIAPSPLIDKYPIIIGQGLSLAYLANAYKLCTQGWRYYFVDAMSELIEHDPHTRGVSRQRVLPLAAARVEVYPAVLPKGDKDFELSKTIADEVRRQLDRLPKRSQALVGLAYGIMSGVSACETVWDRSEGQWEAASLEFIHSRRLNYPVSTSWDLHIWDQGTVGAVGPGTVSGFASGMPATAGAYGMRVADFPGQFLVHEPRLSGEYPVRDGEFRYIGFHVALKRMVVKCSAQDFERTIRPWILGIYNRASGATEKTVADDDDINQLELAVAALGTGMLNSTTLPNACDIKLLRAASSYDLKDFIAFLKDEITTALLGQTHTTAPGAFGNRSASETARKGTLEINRYDARSLADTFESGLVYWIVKLNFPGCEKRLLPRVVLNVDQELDPTTLMEIAKAGTALGLPIDAVDLAERTGLKLVDKDDPDAIRTRMLSPKDGPNPPDPNDPNAKPPGEEKEPGEIAPPGEVAEPVEPKPGATKNTPPATGDDTPGKERKPKPSDTVASSATEKEEP